MKKNIPIVNYNEISGEYYVEDLHPTSNNFRAASSIVIKDFLRVANYKSSDKIVEVGAGKSLVAELLTEMGFSLANTVITDLHRSMLKYSQLYTHLGSITKVISAEKINTKFSDLDFIFSSLGDPYNTIAFWESSYKALVKGGFCVFTTPSFEWAQLFRLKHQGKDNSHAHFILQNGKQVRVPSFVYNSETQIEIAKSVGFELIKKEQINLSQITNKISNKLLLTENRDYPILTGYLFKKG